MKTIKAKRKKRPRQVARPRVRSRSESVVFAIPRDLVDWHIFVSTCCLWEPRRILVRTNSSRI